jgi:hypothetical protein
VVPTTRDISRGSVGAARQAEAEGLAAPIVESASTQEGRIRTCCLLEGTRTDRPTFASGQSLTDLFEPEPDSGVHLRDCSGARLGTRVQRIRTVRLSMGDGIARRNRTGAKPVSLARGAKRSARNQILVGVITGGEDVINY